MDTRYLSIANLREFAARWPDAEAFLTRCSLRNERSILRAHRDTLNVWQQARLLELDALYACQDSLRGEG